MLLRPATLDGIAAGDIDLVFRRQRRRTVKAGGTLRTAIGVVAIDAVDAIDEDDVTDADAGRAGFTNRGEILAMLKPDGQLYRFTVRHAGDDPRIALRNDGALGRDDVEQIRRRLQRLDAASKHGQWTRRTLQLIAQRPETRAADLAASVGRETQPFKTDVRKLKNLGLTESLPVGYRISPRGRAYLEATSADDA